MVEINKNTKIVEEIKAMEKGKAEEFATWVMVN